MQSNFTNDRITLIDVLRGYALMGLFLIHMVEYYELYWYKSEPGLVNTLTFFMFGGKAYAMFALLFGISFFIIMDRQARKGIDFRLRFVWRLTLLLVMGYIHGLMYGGDILQILAITGLFLVPLFRFSNLGLLLISLFFILQGPSLIIYFLINILPGFDYSRPLHWATQPPIFEIYANGSFDDVLRVNMWQGQAGKWAFMLESGRIWNILGLSIFGFLLGRIDFFVNTQRYKIAYIKAFVVALILAVLFYLFRDKAILLASSTQASWIFANIYAAWLNHTLIIISIVGLVLLYQLPALSKVLKLLAPCGRITLTLYVGQSFIFIPFFYGYGAGAYNYIGQPISLVLGLVLWGLQIWFAHCWMRYYYYGPLEWLWRSATWMRTDVPFKRQLGC